MCYSKILGNYFLILTDIKGTLINVLFVFKNPFDGQFVSSTIQNTRLKKLLGILN